jgi:hypothetical protein
VIKYGVLLCSCEATLRVHWRIVSNFTLMMQPSGGIVVKKEYNLQSTPYKCYFCGGKNHITRWYNSCHKYISSGKIIENKGEVYMPDGSEISGSCNDGSFKQRIDKYAGQTLYRSKPECITVQPWILRSLWKLTCWHSCTPVARPSGENLSSE